MTPKLLVAAVFSLLAGCHCGSAPSPASLTIFCGSASKPAMTELAQAFELETGIDTELIFGGSGNLLSQMELSGKGDIYAPGSPDYVIIGERRGQLIEGSDRDVAYLVPAIVTPAGNPAGIRSLEDLAKPGIRVGIGNPETVCLGLYSVELLERAGLLDAVLPNVVTFGASCSKTANLSAMEQVDAVLGWRVFEAWNPSRMEQVPIEPARIPRISTVPIAIPIHAQDRARSERFIDFALSPAGRAAFDHHGYIVDRAAALELAPGADIGGEYQLPDDYAQRLAVIGTHH
jgi:molybdate transport system substrate-binding protein